MNHIIDFLLLQLDPEEKVKFSNTLVYIYLHYVKKVWAPLVMR
jgi:flagellin-specific chaperone FliS